MASTLQCSDLQLTTNEVNCERIGICRVEAIKAPRINSPLLSFYTFMAISYLVDVYRRPYPGREKSDYFRTYLALFPHLIAAHRTLQRHCRQMHNRHTSLTDVTEASGDLSSASAKSADRQHCGGYGGCSVRVAARAAFDAAAWIGLICYTIQIYFDFSGYSDMAIGLARMLGFGSRKISITLMFRNPSPSSGNAGISLSRPGFAITYFSRLGRELAALS